MELRMIEVIKLGNKVIYGTYNKVLDEEGNVVEHIIPEDLDGLKKVAIDTIKFLLKEELSKTDWIITKISDKQINGEDISELVAKYKEELDSRNQAREKYEEVKNKINSIENYDELLNVVTDLRFI